MKVPERAKAKRLAIGEEPQLLRWHQHGPCSVLSPIWGSESPLHSPVENADANFRFLHSRTAFFPVKVSHRLTITSQYFGEISIAKHRRPSCSAAIN